MIQNLNEILEIIIITYNRKDYLSNTLKQLFDDNSPVRSLDVTIINNKSNDGTDEVINEYSKKFNNIKHIINKRNIGGNANIARAFEISSKKYFWILCDDDNYDFQYFDEIIEGIQENYDIILTSKYDLKIKENIATILRQLTFLPSGVYKTENITNDVMQNMMYNVSNMFPHLIAGISVINKNGKIFIPKHEVVKPIRIVQDYNRGINDLHPYYRDMFWVVGFINSIQYIKDKKIKNFVINNFKPQKSGFFRAISSEFKYNSIIYNNSLKNIFDIFAGLNFYQRFVFLIAVLWLNIVYFVKKFILRKI